MKVTLDTNIVVSGFFWNVDARSIMLLFGIKVLKNVISKSIFDEYEEVCFREEILGKTTKSKGDIKQFLEQIKDMSEFVEPDTHFDVIKEDPKDNKFIDAAVKGEADYIITYDRHLLDLGTFNGIQILKPSGFLKALNL